MIGRPASIFFPQHIGAGETTDASVVFADAATCKLKASKKYSDF
jgi:hypothetical protein